MSEWFSGQILIQDIYINYYRTGGSKPPLILLHGFTDSGLCWTPVAQNLEHDYDVIMLDARCHGKSVSPATDFTTEQLVTDVITVIEALNLREVYLLGHSMGAHTASRVALQRPDLIKALLLEDPPWTSHQRPPLTEKAFDSAQKYAETIRFLKTLSPIEGLIEGRKANPNWSDAELMPWFASKQQVNLDVFAQNTLTDRTNWQVFVEHISCPTLLITGDPQLGAITRPEIAQQVLSTWPEGQLARIEHAGHSIRRVQFSAFLTAVRQFLTEK